MVGETPLRLGQISGRRLSSSQGDFGGAVAKGLGQLAGQVQNYADSELDLELAEARANEAERRATLKAQEEIDRNNRALNNATFNELTAKIQAEIAEAQTNMPAGGVGYSENVLGIVDNNLKAYFDKIDASPEQREILESRGRALRTTALTQGFTTETQVNRSYVYDNLSNQVTEFSRSVERNPAGANAAIASLQAQIAASNLDESTKAAMLIEAEQKIRIAQFGGVLVNATGEIPALETDGSDISWVDAQGWERAFLNTIGPIESSNSYNVIHGGSTFEDYSDHPRKRIPLGDGDYSTAAGRYQIIEETWDTAVRELAAKKIIIKDFSPASQDQVALHIAERDYARKAKAAGLTGLATNLQHQLTVGGEQGLVQVQAILGTTWEAFQKIDTQQFANAYRQNMQRPSHVVEQLSQQEAFANLPLQDLAQAERTVRTQQAKVREAERKAAAAREAALVDEIALIATENPQAAYDRYMELEAAGAFTDPANAVKARKVVNDQFELIRSSNEVLTNLHNGYSFKQQEDGAAISNWLQQSGLNQGFASRDKEAYAAVAQVSTRFGFIPSEIHTSLQQMLASDNVADVQFASSFYTDMHNTNPAIAYAGIPEADAKDISALITLGNTAASQGHFFTLYQQWRDPNNKAYREQRKQEAQADMRELDVDDFLDNMDGDEIVSTQRGAFFAEGRQLTELYLGMFGDLDLAKKTAAQHLSRSWGPTPGSEKLMRLSPMSPAAGVKPFQGSYDWLDERVRTTFGLPEDADYNLRADGQTAAELNRGEAPSYYIITKDASGLISPSFNVETGELERVRFDLTETQEKLNTQMHILNNLNMRKREAALNNDGDGARQLEGEAIKLRSSITSQLSDDELQRQIVFFDKRKETAGLTRQQVLDRQDFNVFEGTRVNVTGNEYYQMLLDEVERRK